MLVKDLRIDIPERANAPKTRLHIRVVSENEDSLNTIPYLFMLPGGPGANHSHYKDYECLHSTVNVVFFDPRGCGLSEKGEPSSYTMDNYIQDVDVIRKHLNLEQIALLGKSYGAMCALGYALTFSEHVSSLVLAAGSPSFKNIESARLNIEKRGSLAQQQVCEQLWAGDFKSDEEVDNFFEVMDTMYSWRKRHKLPVNRPTADYAFAREPLNQGFGGFLRTFNYENRLQEVACNTLILVGEEDWVTDKKHSEFMASKISNSQFIVFANADHSMESDVPQEFFSSIETFLKNKVKKGNNIIFLKKKGIQKKNN
ncbi:MAG: Proline iminopeptidase [Legionella sp.]|uniref:alpha/beta fold hydrolase n=1 Tax=Legionella sp. TaxID=459 RepID=UPI003D14EECD